MTFEKWHTEEVCQGKVKHSNTCKYKGWSAPISACPCQCYEEAIWEAGRDSHHNSHHTPEAVGETVNRD